MDPKDQIKENLTIVDVVATYVRLEKSGSQFRGRCPFHNERTPSFYVSPERKSYHCFGCGAHGDIFTFVEKLENIPFIEALRILADRAGVTLGSREKRDEESRLTTLLRDAKDFYVAEFAKSAEALTYVSERGLSSETQKTFAIGYAPNEWRHLFIYLASRGFTPEEMEESGLVIKALDANGKVKGWYDRFRGRVMFPIRNISGATVGFSGRILPQLVDETKAQGKYVNTPETALYHKSKILFGYDTAKKAMNEKKEVVVVEGQMDLCMSYQSGVHHTIAVSGTAFTDDHIKMVKRFCDRVVLSFDSDSAGQAALKKSALLCLYGGLDVYAVLLDKKDPADMIRENPTSWHEALAKKVHVIDLLTGEALKSSLPEREKRAAVVRDVIPFIVALRSPVDRDYFLTRLSDTTGIDKKSLLEEMERVCAAGLVEEVAQEALPSSTTTAWEKRLREVVAYHGLKKMELPAVLDPHKDYFPAHLLEEEIVRLERLGDVRDAQVHAAELLEAFISEDRKERVRTITALLRTGEGDAEALMKELQSLSTKK